jgi:uncharacterized protein YggE
MRFVIVFATLMALGLPAMADEGPRLTVTGEGRVDTAPDMATISLGVTTEGDTARAALDANNAQLDAVLDRLRAAGIEDRDMQTTGLSLNPRYNYDQSSGGGNQITGFTASNAVTVRVRALDALGGILDASVGDGANTLNGLSFGLADPVPATDEARKRAVADARRKAELYAAAAGVSLGAVQSISEQMSFGGPMPMAMADAGFAKEASVPVATGEVGMAAQVTIVYAISQ